MKYKHEAEGLNKRIGIRLTQAEFEKLKAQARKHKVTMSTYIRNYLKYEVMTI